MKTLTQHQIARLFDYDSLTGELVRKNATKGYDGNRRITRRNDQGYSIVTVNGHTYRVHHLVWTLHHGTHVEEIDHINRVKHDNRIENLRVCEHYRNCGNSEPRRSFYKGVTYCKATGKWKAQIGVMYKNINLGRYITAEDAARAYNVAAIDHFGEFAYLNNV